MKETLYCNQCFHKWFPRGIGRPFLCPNCKDSKWDYLGENNKCEVCNRTFLIISTHHINGDHSDNDIKNKIRVCSNCHRAIHSLSDLKIKKHSRTRDYNTIKQLKIRHKILILRKKVRKPIFKLDQQIKEMEKEIYNMQMDNKLKNLIG